MTADLADRLLYGHPEKYFAEHRELERAGRYEEAAHGFEDFSNRWGYQVWTEPLALRCASRLIAIGTKIGDQRLIDLGIERGNEFFPRVGCPEAMVEFWNRLAILFMETGEFESARHLLDRCARATVRDQRFAVSASLTSAILAARTVGRDVALTEFGVASAVAVELGMDKALDVARLHFDRALRG
jgi:hypothetical protein